MTDWPAVIERNREALLRIVEALFALIGLEQRNTIAALPRCTRNYVLRILRPAKSAARRLIVAVARGIEVATPALPLGGGESDFDGLAARSGAKRRKSQERGSLALPILDTLKRFDFAPRRSYATTTPRVRSLGDPALPVYMRLPDVPAKPLPSPGDPLSAIRLCARMHALKRALDDIPGQAKRLARWQARCDLRRKLPDRKPGRISPMRPGWPPGHRKRPARDIDHVLRECHALAHQAQRADTS